MDEKYLEQAQALEQSRRDNAQAALQRMLRQPGRAECEDCGESIPRARRLAVPSAIRCIKCQQLFEKVER